MLCYRSFAGPWFDDDKFDIFPREELQIPCVPEWPDARSRAETFRWDEPRCFEDGLEIRFIFFESYILILFKLSNEY